MPEKDIDFDRLADLLKPETKIGMKLEAVLKDLPDGYAMLLVVAPKSYGFVSEQLINVIGKIRKPFVFLTANKPAKELAETAKKIGVDLKQAVFIDAISRMAGKYEEKGWNFIYVDSPANLSELGGHITSSAKNDGIVVVDSVSSLLIYNKADALDRFCHFVAERTRGNSRKLVFVAVDSAEAKPLIETLSQFCDRVEKLG